jgi:diguanylate cyclase (GGDEF)-like protein
MLLLVTVTGVLATAFLAWLFWQRTEMAASAGYLRGLERENGGLRADVTRLGAEKQLLSGFLGVLPALAQELRYATTERQITSTLLDTLVSTIEPREAVVLMRRKRGEDGRGIRFVVAAATPRTASIPLGLEIALAADDSDPKALGPAAIRRAGLELPADVVTVPMIIETQAVGLIALCPSAPNPDVPLVVRAVADVGALALHEAAARLRLETAAHVDELTGLFNKRYVGRVLSEELRKAQQAQGAVSVFLFDVDHFKHYNDVNGHLAGDIFLRLLSQLVRDNVRATDVVGRFGGEEFLLILPGSSLSEAFLVADKLRLLIASHAFPARERQPNGTISVSGGVAEFPVHGSATPALLKAADEALYVAKRAGRNMVVRAIPETKRRGEQDTAFEEAWEVEP